MNLITSLYIDNNRYKNNRFVIDQKKPSRHINGLNRLNKNS